MQNMVGDSVKKIFKCRKCRHFLFADNQLLDSHGKPVSSEESSLVACTPISNVMFLREDFIPTWLKNQVNVGGWTKGKVFCPTCNCRIGSFDFVCGTKCKCGSSVLPAIHVVSCKLDSESKQRTHVLTLSEPIIQDSTA